MSNYQEKMDKKMLENATKLEAQMKRLEEDLQHLKKHQPSFSVDCAIESFENALDTLGTMIADLRFG